MKEILTARDCQTFVECLASKDPAPGGGGASALTGALGAALGSMVANLTIPNPRYEAVAEEMRGILEEMNDLSGRLLACVQEDADGFIPLSKAYGLPKDTEEARVTRDIIMEDALKKACEAPAGMIRLCARAMELTAVLAEKGGKLVISDAGTGAVLLRSAMEGALLNVFVNTRLMKDRDYAEALNASCEERLRQSAELADRIYRSVKERLL
ncbi:MAG: cyclodeaminase/cyclohydrolase family protein [Lachnospiraceae bacterium]|nr:cyclodeaminase/cyclohydrolase family protein [Lachnospiraceae bacterium]